MSKIPASSIAYQPSNLAAVRASLAQKASAVNEQAIKGKVANLHEKIERFDGQVVQSAGDRFKENAFGSADVGKGVGSFFDQVSQMNSGRSKNPLDGAKAQDFTGGRQGHVSEDPAEGAKQSEEFSWSTFFGSVVEGVFGLFAPRGSPTGLLTGPGTVESVTGRSADLLDGVQAVAQSGDKDPRMKAILDDMDKEPLPDDTGSSPTIITRGDIKGLEARRGSKGEPVNDDAAGSGGPVAAPKVTQQGEWINEVGSSAAVTARDLEAIQIRLTSKFTSR